MIMVGIFSSMSLMANPADYAEVMVGKYDYVYGAKGTGNKFHGNKTEMNEIDCSGLVQKAYKEDGKTINNGNPLSVIGFSKSKQFKHILRRELKRGDIIIWAMDDSEWIAQHITIYAGNNKLISAESVQMDVIKVPCFNRIRPKIKKGKYTWYNRYNLKRVFMCLRYK